MRKNYNPKLRIVVPPLLAALSILPVSAHAYHFFHADIDGCRWALVGPSNVDFLVDASSTTALGTSLLTEVTAARDAWSNIGTAQNVLGDFTQAGEDYTIDNYGVAWGLGPYDGAADGQNEVVLDEVGDIISTLTGRSALEINGFGPSVQEVVGGTCTITDAFNLLNGTRSDFDRQSTTIHEFGHIQGLAHSSVGEFNSRNSSAATSGYASPSAALQPINIARVPTMHLFSNGTGANRRTPEQDDVSGLSELYPEGSFFASTGSIEGTVTRCTDDTPLQGVNVRAVSRSDPNLQVTRYSAFDSNGIGRYIINGLPEGQYDVIVEPMGFNNFTAGRMAIQTATDSGFPMEYYGPTAAEENDCIEGGPDSPLAVSVSAGTTIPDINVKVNGGVPLAFVVDDTGSMSAEIGAVRDILNAFVDIVDAIPFLDFPKVALVTFKDTVTLRGVTSDPDELRTMIDGLFASGGGDCPESSNAAVLEAGRILREDGVAILFTDADSRPNGPTTTQVSSYYNATSKSLSVMLSATCSEEFSSSLTALSAPLAPAGSTFDLTSPTRSAEQAVERGDVAPDSGLGIDPRSARRDIGAAGPEFDEYEEPPTLGFVDGVATFVEIASETGGVFKATPRPYSGDERTAYIATGTNLSVSALVPAVALTTPNSAPRGSALLVEIQGSNTNWNTSSSVTFAGSGITVSGIVVNSPESITIGIDVPAGASVGFYDVQVVTDLGGGTIETSTGIGAFQVTADTAPSVTSVTPFTVSPGDEIVDVVIHGANTAWTAGSTVSFIDGSNIDPAIMVNAVTVNSATQVTVNISVASDAAVGLRDVFVDGVTKADSFMVAPAPAPIPRVTDVTPGSVEQGRSGLALIVSGENTGFDGATTVAFSGTGVTTSGVTVNSATQLTATVNVAVDAALGFRDVIVTTGDESAVLLNGLQILPDTLPADSDGDGVLDADDQCVPTPNGEVVDATGCSIAELCPCEHPTGEDKWKNHGAYVSCVAHTSEDFLAVGLITEAEKDATMSAAGESNCGHKSK